MTFFCAFLRLSQKQPDIKIFITLSFDEFYALKLVQTTGAMFRCSSGLLLLVSEYLLLDNNLKSCRKKSLLLDKRD
jgi:hypothetical protein